MNVNNELQSESAFSLQSKIFDELYRDNAIIQYKRERVRAVVKQFAANCGTVLELNSGTGEDAIWFAQQGYKVHATDISTGMQDILNSKINSLGLQQKVSTEIISFTNLENLREQKEYDLIFSNFAGLNCTEDLHKVLGSFSSLLKPKGVVVLAVLPKFCLWEFLLLFKGKFKTAFRRFFSSKGATAHMEGIYFRCWYYNPSYIIKHLQHKFNLLTVEGLCTIVPPSYIDSFAEKRPGLFTFLKSTENKWKKKWPWKCIGDYYIIALEKK
ncbi:MAG: class I SAM-dependent methyltransferase [Ferruginibacter sp.]